MVYLKDSIRLLETMSFKKLIRDIKAYKSYIKENNVKINGIYILAFNYFDELIDRLLKLDSIGESLMVKANSILMIIIQQNRVIYRN